MKKKKIIKNTNNNAPQEKKCMKHMKIYTLLNTVMATNRYNHKPNEIEEFNNLTEDLFNEFKANNTAEEMIISQIISVYQHSMECFRKVNFSNGVIKIDDIYLRQANNLTKTYIQLIELLHKMQGTNITEQKVTVQHVNVNEGGKAIVGNIGGAKNNKSKNKV